MRAESPSRGDSRDKQNGVIVSCLRRWAYVTGDGFRFFLFASPTLAKSRRDNCSLRAERSCSSKNAGEKIGDKIRDEDDD